MKKLTFFDYLICVIFLIGFILIYIGFWDPDPRIFYGNRAGTATIVLWALRVGVPVLGIGALALYLGTRLGKVPKMGIAVIGICLLLAVLLFYPVAAYIYYGNVSDQKLAKFHPYLQVSPNPIQFQPIENEIQPFRIFCVGGSTTEYPDERGREWPRLVQENLGMYTATRPIEVYNCGREWYTSQHTLLQYFFQLRQLKPDLILVLHGINDVFINIDFNHFCRSSFQPDYRHYAGAVARLVEKKSMERSALDFLDGLWYFEPRSVVRTDSFPGLTSFEKNINTFIDICRLDSIPVILITQPFRYQIDMPLAERAQLAMFVEQYSGKTQEWAFENMVSACGQYNDCLKKIAQNRNVQLIDLEKRIPKTQEYFFDEVHFKAIAFDTISAVVSRHLHESGYLPLQTER